jgi:hypothetical protein
MNRPTLSSFRALFPCEALGVCQSDPKVRNYCNEATERLLMDPMAPDEGWWGGWVAMQFSASVAANNAAYITTPREVARLTDVAVCQRPIPLRNHFYEYLDFSPGLQPKNCHHNSCGSTFQGYSRDNVCTLNPLLPTPQKIRIYPFDARDINRRVLIQGKDNNKMTVLTTDPGTGQAGEGEYLTLKFPFTDSLNLFSELDGLQKDQCYGMIQLFQVNPDTGVEVALSAMEPNESTASYRLYLIAGIPNLNQCCQTSGTLQLSAQARLAFIPVTNETDYLMIPNVAALIEESMSIHYGRMDSSLAAQQTGIHHQRALALLVGQLDQMLGKTSTAISVPIWGSRGRLRRQPV